MMKKKFVGGMFSISINCFNSVDIRFYTLNGEACGYILDIKEYFYNSYIKNIEINYGLVLNNEISLDKLTFNTLRNVILLAKEKSPESLKQLVIDCLEDMGYIKIDLEKNPNLFEIFKNILETLRAGHIEFSSSRIPIKNPIMVDLCSIEKEDGFYFKYKELKQNYKDVCRVIIDKTQLIDKFKISEDTYILNFLDMVMQYNFFEALLEIKPITTFSPLNQEDFKLCYLFMSKIKVKLLENTTI